MAVHKQKREEAVRQSEKITAENLKIAEKAKELRAKKQKLERLETKVIYDCIIGMLRACHNSQHHWNSFFSITVKDWDESIEIPVF